MITFKNKKVIIFCSVVVFSMLGFKHSFAYDCTSISCVGVTGTSYQNCLSVKNICNSIKENNCDAVSCDGLTGESKNKCEDSRDTCKKLDSDAKDYFKRWELTQKTKSTLNAQLSELAEKIDGTQEEIKENSGVVEVLNDDIKKLEGEIRKKENMIVNQKKILSEMVRFYYDNNLRSDVSFLVDNAKMFALLTEGDYLGQVSKKIQEMLVGIKEMQEQLKEDVASVESKKEKINQESEELAEKTTYLESTKVQKKNLLVQTRGEEEKYQEKLKKIEAQKQELLGDIDELYNANYYEVEELNLQLEKPKSGLASTSWYYSQKDSRWKDQNIGNSKSKIKDYGCAISSVAMVFTYHGDRVTPSTLATKPIFYWDLISWPNSSAQIGFSSNLNLAQNTNHSGVNWGTVDKEISAGNPVIVFVGAKGKAGHYVVIHGKDKKGKYVVHDPYFGPNIYLESTMKLLSKLYSVSISNSSINQMILYK